MQTSSKSAPKETAQGTIDPAAGGMSGAEEGPMSNGPTACREPRATDGDGVRPRLETPSVSCCRTEPTPRATHGDGVRAEMR
jgi:hypothetical protein